MPNPQNLRMLRIQPKIEELFRGKIDLTDVKNPNDREDKFYTRSLAALAVVMRCGIDYDIAAQSVTDGYHDMGIDAVYNDAPQKKLLLVQSKWRKDGTGGISLDEANTFTTGIKRILNFDFAGCNEKLAAKQQEITAAICDMDYQIEVVYCHTGNEAMNTYAQRPFTELLSQVNEDDSADLLVLVENKLQDIYEYLANGQNGDDIVLDDVLLTNWGSIDTPFKAYMEQFLFQPLVNGILNMEIDFLPRTFATTKEAPR